MRRLFCVANIFVVLEAVFLPLAWILAYRLSYWVMQR